MFLNPIQSHPIICQIQGGKAGGIKKASGRHLTAGMNVAMLLTLLLTMGCSGYQVTVQGVNLDRFSESEPAPIGEGEGEPSAADHNNLGVLLEKEGDLEGALAQYRIAREKDPGFTVAYVNAGNVWFKLNNTEQAIRLYRSALDLDPEQPRALNNLAWVYIIRKEKFPEAILLLEKARAADPEHSYLYLDSLGWARHLAGQTGAAIADLTSALEEIPAEEVCLLGEVHYHLGLICRERGADEQAEFHLKKSLELDPSPEREKEVRNILNQISGG